MRRDAASDLGLGVAPIAARAAHAGGRPTVGNWRAPDDQTYDVNVRLAPDVRNSPADLARLPFVSTAMGANADGSTRIVRLHQVAEVREGDRPEPDQPPRRWRARWRSTPTSTGRSAGEVSADIRAALDGIAFPPGYRYQFSGSTKNMQESFGYAVSALALAIIFIYMILASQFKSFLQPLALMTALPLTLIGVVLALLMFRSTLSMFSIIGIVMLMGLVTKNAILLVDFAIRAREPGMRRRHRCRPAARRGAAAGRARAAAPDPDDHAGDDLRHGAAGLRAQRRLGAARAHGPGRDRRRHHLVAADAGGGAGRLLLPGRPGELAAPAAAHFRGKVGSADAVPASKIEGLS